MRAMKDSGIEWIGEIPKEWSLMRLCNITQRIFLGRTPVYYQFENKNYIIGQKNNQKTGICFDGIKFGEQSFYSSCPKSEFLTKGDVLLNTLGGGSVGRIGYWNIDDEQNYLTDGHLMVIRSNATCFSKYLYYSMYCQQRILEDESVGSTNQAFLTITQVYKKKIPFPPRSEQNRIADFLDRKCAEIDSVIAETQRTIEEYKALKQSIITEAVTKGIRGKRETKKCDIEWIEEIPIAWQECRIKNAIFPREKSVYEKDEIITCFRDGEVTLRKNRREDGFTISFTEHGYHGVDVGDLVIHGMDAFAGAIGCSDSRGKTTPVVHVCDTIGNNRYFMYYLRSLAYGNVLMDWSNGVRIRSSDFRNFAKLGAFGTIVPPIGEQNEIVAYLDEKTSKIDTLIIQKTCLLSELESYKKSVIYEYVTGKKEMPAV